jgi:MHS family proline/betaine transporter-like MFS transporter
MSQAAMGVSPAGGTDLDVATRRRAIISSAVGNFVELYDFLIYGMFAVQIAATFIDFLRRRERAS